MDGNRDPFSDLAAHQDDTRRLVRAMMTLTGLTASGLARAAGLTPSTLNRFMNKDVGHTLSSRTMLALMAETFTLLHGRPVATLDPAAVAALAPAIPVFERGILELAPEAKPLLAEIKASGPVGLSRASLAELPVVMATSQGIDVAAGDFTRAPLKAPRPPFLADDPLAFALLMPDTSMSPRFDAGDMLYVSPSRTLDGAADVVVDKGAGFAVGSLAGTGAQVRVNTLSPRARHTFERARIRGVYPIVGLQRLGM
ncbi:MAG: helix-turn-helix domain-containing protein [Rhodospirillaceae bacterium]|nr:helix-turn-helix domain-containing protein [Rhodospirillaceae bacterium]